MSHPRVEIFCDGSCLKNPGPGGWAALLVIEKDGERKEKLLSGGARESTNNRMELIAAIEGLRALKRPCQVELFTDSQYVVKGMTDWIWGWMKRGWKTSARRPGENRDLWEALLEESRRHEVSWHWVKGHAGHPENERVDALARAIATRFDGGELS